MFSRKGCKVKENLSYLTRSRPDLGEISFLKALPICAPPKGSLPALNSRSRLKFTNIPWAVSGLRKLELRNITITLTHINCSVPIIHLLQKTVFFYLIRGFESNTDSDLPNYLILSKLAK